MAYRSVALIEQHLHDFRVVCAPEGVGAETLDRCRTRELGHRAF